jgi:putative PIN family toxin of toxin-antitoxin system
VKLAVDINVLVSGTLWKGNPARLVDALLDGYATLCASAAMMTEFEEVIQREKFKERLEQSGRGAHEIISRFRSAALIVEAPAIAVPAALRDPDDIHVLACATAAHADAIVTGDEDLLSMNTFAGIPILAVRQALEMIGISPA